MPSLKKHQSGAVGLIELALVVVLLGFAGFVVWRVVDTDKQTSDSQVSTTQGSESKNKAEEKEEKEEAAGTNQESLPEGYIRYENKELGFSFGYPKEWGELKLGEPFYGSEKEAGPARTLEFTECPGGCKKGETSPLGVPTPEIGLSSRNFGGIGSSRPSALNGGFERITDGFLVYVFDNKKQDFSNLYTMLETKELAGALFMRYTDTLDTLHAADTTRVIVNLPKSNDYTGLTFLIHDKVGETTNSELLRTIASTLKLTQ